MLKIVKIACISIILTIFFAVPVLAGTEAYGPGTVKIMESRLRVSLGDNWVVDGRYALDKDTGEIYFAEDGENFVFNTIADDGSFYNADGIQTSSLTYVRDKYLMDYEVLLEDGDLTFSSRQEATLFICWLQLERADRQGIRYNWTTLPNGNTKIVKSELLNIEKISDDCESYHSAVQDIARLIPEHDSIREKVDYATILAAKRMTYDKDYKERSMSDAVRDGRGVCYHYAKLLEAVLSELNIESEFVAGYADSSDSVHVWLKIRDADNGQWLYRDPTKTSADLQAGLFTVYIYEAYLQSYRVMSIRQDASRWHA